MEIPDSVWLRMQGKTYIENPHITRSDLRYLRVLHWDYDNKTHRGELVCNRLIADSSESSIKPAIPSSASVWPMITMPTTSAR